MHIHTQRFGQHTFVEARARERERHSHTRDRAEEFPRALLSPSAIRKRKMAPKAAVLRALATALELSASCNEDGCGVTTVTLPNGWVVNARAPDSFDIELPDGTKCASPKAIQQLLQSLDEPQSMEDTTRKSGRNRMRPLDFWANERVVYGQGEVIGVVVNN